MLKLLPTLSMMFLANDAVACVPRWFSPAEEIVFAKIGHVISERYLTVDDSSNRTTQHKRLLRVAIIENLRGPDQEIVEVPAVCGALYPKISERVVVLAGRDGYMRVYPGEKVEADLRIALENQPTPGNAQEN